MTLFHKNWQIDYLLVAAVIKISSSIHGGKLLAPRKYNTSMGDTVLDLPVRLWILLCVWWPSYFTETSSSCHEHRYRGIYGILHMVFGTRSHLLYCIWSFNRQWYKFCTTKPFLVPTYSAVIQLVISCANSTAVSCH